MKSLTVIGIAAIAHALNAAYCQSIGDASQPKWQDAPDWQKDSAIKGVEFHLANPESTPEGSHESWLEQKKSDGWKYGPVKDAEKKEHPCFVPYAELPTEQKAKDYIFKATIEELKPYLEEPQTEYRQAPSDILEEMPLSEMLKEINRKSGGDPNSFSAKMAKLIEQELPDAKTSRRILNPLNEHEAKRMNDPLWDGSFD